MPLSVALLFNQDQDLAHGGGEDALAVQAVQGCARSLAEALARRGLDARLVPIGRDPRAALALLAELEADVVFNLVEAVGGDACLESSFAGALELAGLAFTGSPAQCLAAALDKPLTQSLLAAAGVRVPRGAVLARHDATLSELAFPCIVKPAREDASHGIELESVVHDERALRERARFVIERYAQPALVEEFIDGREFNLALLDRGAGLELLSPGEIDFSTFGARPKVVTYSGKWIAGSWDWNHTGTGAAHDLSPEQLTRLESLALAAAGALWMRDYGRIDVRADATGALYVIDVNPNPDLSPDAGYALAAARDGLSHDELAHLIVRRAFERALARPRGR